MYENVERNMDTPSKKKKKNKDKPSEEDKKGNNTF